MVHPSADGVVVIVHIGNELEDAFIQLRQQHGGQQIEKERDDQPGQQDARRPDQHGLGPLPLPPGAGREQAPLEKVHHGGQQIGDEGPVKNRLHRLQQGQHGLAAEEGVVEQQNGGGGQERRHPHADIVIFPFHGPRLPFPLFFFHSTRGRRELQSSFSPPLRDLGILTVISQALCYTVP